MNAKGSRWIRSVLRDLSGERRKFETSDGWFAVPEEMQEQAQKSVEALIEASTCSGGDDTDLGDEWDDELTPVIDEATLVSMSIGGTGVTEGDKTADAIARQVVLAERQSRLVENLVESIETLVAVMKMKHGEGHQQR